MGLKLRGENMVKNNNVDLKQLYRNMVELERAALEAQDSLLEEVKKYLMNIISKDCQDTTKISLAAGGYIQIRTTEDINADLIDKFKDDFNFNLTWTRKESMIDLRNVEKVSVDVYEYAFIPADIQKILGDNQVDMNPEV